MTIECLLETIIKLNLGGNYQVRSSNLTCVEMFGWKVDGKWMISAYDVRKL